jgi:hypothetical protein
MIFRIGNATVSLSGEGTVIAYPDGTQVVGQPEDTDAYRATAVHYGYGNDTLQLCIDHELMHLALADWLDLPESPTMRAVRHNRLDDDLALRALEEAAVLAVQQFARAAGVDVVAWCLAHATRP